MNTKDLKTKGPRWFKMKVVHDQVDAAGRHHREYEGYETFYLENGEEMEVNAWGKAYRQALIDEGREDLYNAVLKHISGLPFLKTQAEKELYAAECIESQAYLSEQWRKGGFRIDG